MPMTPKEMIRYLKKNGFVFERQRGSHVILKNSETGKKAVIPYHSKDLKKGIEQKILKDAGLK
jgi:Predicted periplasmic or secreted lipoprotein